ncbi:MAG TPA: calcium-binding protein [Phenylobacterium sp.]|jgi:Ca2+-binding RTX toxin-like protein|uniref:calcium-binding protein n=1 Tax=Phenylobacterium sp. TaxID=1871053 RepID=UPI002C3AB090|nr:calcium-binding protein [Phenylobacterium sp.]HXA37669.1 calcium-binding protein [Phenylobacterium sp.]
MTIGTVDAAFPAGTNMDQIEVGLIGVGVNSAETASGFTVTVGSEQLVFGGAGLTYDGAGVLTGGTVTSIQDLFQGAVNFNLSGFSISAASLANWAAVDDNNSLMSALFSGADTLTGGPQDDLLRSYAGNDSLSGGAGNDTLDGGAGNDTIDGGPGHDVITTGGGADVILIGKGQSAVSAAGADVITDWSSTDTLTFAHGPVGASDYVETTAADFTTAATTANGLIAAGTANVVVVAVGADVVVFADSGNDNGVADDAVILQGRSLADISINNFTLSSPPTVGGGPPVTGTTPTPTPTPPPAPTGGTAGAPSVTVGTAGDDFINATPSASEVHAGAGNDTIIGTTVPDYLRGDDGDDLIQGGPAFDDINGNKGNDTIDGGSGGSDWLVGGQGDDMITAHHSDNLIYGNLGNDTLIGGDGHDIMRGGQGDDSIVGGSGNDFISGDRGNDTESGGLGADTFHFSQDAGIDKVLDYNYAQGDRVMLDPGTTFTVSQVGADTIIDTGGGNEMILVGVQLSTLPKDWIFGF